jgi:hypothetical protein
MSEKRPGADFARAPLASRTNVQTGFSLGVSRCTLLRLGADERVQIHLLSIVIQARALNVFVLGKCSRPGSVSATRAIVGLSLAIKALAQG